MEENQKPIKKLYRSRQNRIIFGVCGGLGEYFGLDPIIFRLIFVALTFGGGAGILLYIVMAFLVPNTPLGERGAEIGFGGTDFREQAQGLASELKENENWSSRRNWLGIIIIIFGGLLLLDQLIPRHLFSWGFVWPALIIVLGFLILRGKKRTNNKNDVSSEPETSEPEPSKQSFRERHHRRHHRGSWVWRLFFGLLLVVLGIAFLAQNLGLVSNINFSYLFKFWPALIIFWGLLVLSRGTWVGVVLSVIFALIIIGLIIFFFFWPMKIAKVKTYNFDIQKDAAVSRADVTVKTGAAVVKIGGGAASLASDNLESNITQLKTSSEIENGTQLLKIETENNTKMWAGNLKNNLQINLSENIPLSLTISSGASDFYFDSSNLQLENFNLKSGVSKLNLIFGAKVAQATADIDAGVSDINISLPPDLGAKLYAKTGMTSQNFADFRQIDENNFESNNYASSTSKIDIRLEAGVSNISVTWR